MTSEAPSETILAALKILKDEELEYLWDLLADVAPWRAGPWNQAAELELARRHAQAIFGGWSKTRRRT